jgi:hypothetical protein
MITDFDNWKQELLSTGKIIQDEDDSKEAEESRGRLFDRYVELVKIAAGVHTSEVFQALMDSLQARHHYGAYNATFRALQSFPHPEFSQYLVASLPTLIRQNPGARAEEWVSDILCNVEDDAEVAQQFNFYLSQAPVEELNLISHFLFQLQENEGLAEDTPLGLK